MPDLPGDNGAAALVPVGLLELCRLDKTLLKGLCPQLPYLGGVSYVAEMREDGIVSFKAGVDCCRNDWNTRVGSVTQSQFSPADEWL